MTTSIQPNMIPMRDVSSISKGDRLFYELGYVRSIFEPTTESNWIRTGQFKEVENVSKYIKGGILLNNPDYLKHHNFMLIKK